MPRYTLHRSDIGSRESYQIRADDRLVGRIAYWPDLGWVGRIGAFETREAAAEAVYLDWLKTRDSNSVTSTR